MISNQSSFHQMKDNIRHSYDEFQSQRNQTSNSMDIGSYHVDIKETGIEYHIKLPVQALLTHFKQTLNKKGYKVTEVFPGKLLVVKLNICDRLKYIFGNKKPQSYFLTLETYQYRSVRRLHIEKVVMDDGENQDIEQLTHFIQREPLNITSSPYNNHTNNQQNLEMDQYQQDMYSLDATATYMYHKIFVDSNYSIGKKMKKLLQKGQVSKKQGMTDDLQIEELPSSEGKMVIGALNQITYDMLQNFNCTRKELLQILGHCRKAVEDYYHNRNSRYKPRYSMKFEQSEMDQQLKNCPLLNEKIPLTINIMKGLQSQKNSWNILRGFFFVHHIFDYECLINKSESDKKQLGAKLGKIFNDTIEEKIKILQVWGYSQQCWQQYILPFMAN